MSDQWDGAGKTWLRRCFAAGMAGLFPAVAMAAEGGLTAPDNPDLTATGLLIAGVVFLLLEIKIVSFGILALMGTAALFLSGLVIWMEGDGTFWGIPLAYYIPFLVLLFIPLLALGIMGAQAYKQKVQFGREGFIGELAEASENLDLQGRVFFQGTYWQAVSTAPVAAGKVVRVTGVDRLTLYVEPVVEGE